MVNIVKITDCVAVYTPALPNFLRQKGGSLISVEDVSEESLREIGKVWTEQLVQKAKNKPLTD